jgi:hypothetical protein
MYLSGLFITSLVVSNLIFQKFFSFKPFGDIEIFGAPIFEASVGLLPYPKLNRERKGENTRPKGGKKEERMESQ